MLPKELKEFDLGISVTSQGIISLESIQKEDPSIKVNGFEVYDAINFKIDLLPAELKVLYISQSSDIKILNDSNFDLDKLPIGLKELGILTGLTDAKNKELEEYIKNHNLEEFSPMTDVNRIGNPEPFEN